jgi:hypothetical protein
MPEWNAIINESLSTVVSPDGSNQTCHTEESIMSRSLRSMPEEQRNLAITRRLYGNSKGLGYWAAVDASALVRISNGDARRDSSHTTEAAGGRGAGRTRRAMNR